MRKTKLARLAGAAVVGSLAAGSLAALGSATPAFAIANPTITYPSGSATQFDGQQITIGALPAGSFTPSTPIKILECQGTQAAPPPDASACYGNTLAQITSASDGSWPGGTYRTYLLGIPGYTFGNAGGLHVDASGSHPGVLYIGENYNDFSANKTFANFTVGLYGALVPQTSGTAAHPTAFAGGTAVPVNAAANAPSQDSAGNAMTIDTYAVATQSVHDGTAACTAASGACTYTPNNPAFTGPNPDAFAVSAVGHSSAGTVSIPNVTEKVWEGTGNPPTLAPTQTTALPNNNAGSQATFNPNAAGTDSGGNAETITQVTPGGTPQYGTVTCATTTQCTYTLGGGPQPIPSGGANETFTLTGTAKTTGAAGNASAPSYTSTPTTVTFPIPPSYTAGCDATTGTGAQCSLWQIIDIPVIAGDLTMAQNSSLPTDTLNQTLDSTGACSGPAIKLNGQPQYACGYMAPITVVNARGNDNGWDLTGQVTDFIDSGSTTNLKPETTQSGTLANSCDTVASYNNHCIPGGNLGWLPASAVAHNIVPGDVAQVQSGLIVPAPGFAAPGVATGYLTGNCGTYVVTGGPSNSATNKAGTYYLHPTSADPSSGVGPYVGTCSVQPAANSYGGAAYATTELAGPGLHTAAQTLCSSSELADSAGRQAGTPAHAGGTFVCGAQLIVAVPASAAAPTAPGLNSATGYEAYLTLTLA